MESLPCSACGAPYHEATGHWFSEKTRLCGPCAKDLWKWFKGQMSRRSGGLRFYDYVLPVNEKCTNPYCSQLNNHTGMCD